MPSFVSVPKKTFANLISAPGIITHKGIENRCAHILRCCKKTFSPNFIQLSSFFLLLEMAQEIYPDDIMKERKRTYEQANGQIDIFGMVRRNAEVLNGIKKRKKIFRYLSFRASIKSSQIERARQCSCQYCTACTEQ